MPPPKKTEYDFEHDFAIRRLNDAVEVLTEQVEKNAEAARQNREEILVIKTKIATVAVLAGLIGGGAVTAVVKMLTH